MFSRMCTHLRSDGLWRVVAVVMGVALVARLAFFFYFFVHGGEAALLPGDGLRYLSLADSTLSGHGYMYEGALEAYRAPGYPLYFMLFRLLHAPLWSASLLQTTVSAGIAGWVVWFSRIKLGLPVWAACIAGLFAALEPDQVYYSVMLLPDVFFSIATLATFTYVLRWFDTGLFRYVFYAGLAIGIGNYFRPALMYLPFFLAVAFFFFAYAWWRPSVERGSTQASTPNVNRGSVKHAAIATLLVIVTAFGVMAPWYMRNEYVFGAFGFVSSQGYTQFTYDAVATTAAVEHRTYQDVKVEMLAQASAQAPDPNLYSFADGKYLTDQTLAVVIAHPKDFLKVYFLGLSEFWTIGNYQYLLKSVGLLAPPSQSVSYTMLLASQGLHAAISSFIGKIFEPFILVALFDRTFWFCICLIALTGLVLYRREPAAWLALLFALYFSATILSVSIGVEARHRYALDPLLFAFTVAALHILYARFRDKKSGA